ncbi:hypothetical protein EQZ23_15135 [Sphingomonas sp. UV9]|uniref:hypothetical protein n=1 Tax=Sphingomonas sp. UV9 TaxID=1851410 RepID=UPI000FFB78EE|nr:hypothetical protein [Sphingomonas sp. UV9]RXD03653.1 hypothetical protein EQZ23_15135 [Sphingomonas sp. UV9]
MPDQDRIVAIGLLTQRDIFALGHDLSRVYPIDEMPCFGSLLCAIDDADRAFHRDRDARQLANPVPHGATSRA